MNDYNLLDALSNGTLNIVTNTTTRSKQTLLCNSREPYNHLFTAALILLSIVGTMENSLVLITIGRYKALRNQGMVLIGALTTIDLLTSVIVIPLYVVCTFDSSVSWHKVKIILMIVVVTLSLLTAVYISIDRFVHVLYLQKHNITRKRSIVGLLAFWIVPFVLFFSHQRIDVQVFR